MDPVYIRTFDDISYSRQLGGDETLSELIDRSKHALKLIDFGQSVDMSMFDPDVEFMTRVETDGFQCVEMQTGRPWTYQVGHCLRLWSLWPST